ncbi:class III lanthipeptide [Staphylococcus ureilyticus]|nr:class III lanthipeptide [Staphylococcus ureilyticus]MBM9448526.1 class III lanthipeptide [Staphylococcus ureilyticus]
MEDVLELQKLASDEADVSEKGYTPTTVTTVGLSTISNGC